MRKNNKIVAFGLATVMAVSLAACGTSITGISMTNTPDTLEKDQTIHISAEYAYTGRAPAKEKADKMIAELGLTYTSSDPDILKVDDQGNVTAVAPGQAEITIASADGTITAEKSIVVKVTPTDIDMPDTIQMAMDSPMGEIEAKAIPEDATDAHISFASSDESIVTVDDSGSLMAVSAGEAMIVASVDGTDVSEECKVTVLPSAEKITLSESKISLPVDETADLTFTVEPENACTDYKSWYSSDESIATVDENGKITAHKTGTCDISLAISDVNASCKVTVKKAASKPAASTKSSAASAQNTSAPAPAEASAPEAQSNNASAAAPAAPASGGSSEPTPGSGHGVWTVFGDGQAYNLINELRASLGLNQWTWSDSLGDVAAERCKQLMVDFSHNGMTAPEICAMNTPDAASTVAAWTGSSAHYAVMTNPSFTQVGIAHFYDGDGCHYWCACFG